MGEKKIIHWMKYRLIYFLISSLVIGYGIFGIIKWNFVFGIDFKGGAIIEYRLGKDVSTQEIAKKLEENGIKVSSIQKTENNIYLLHLGSLDLNAKEKVNSTLLNISEKSEELKFENVGPTIGPELIKKTLYAIAIASGVILLWVAYQFKSIKFGASAVLAMFHDSLVLLGSFSIFGHFWGAEIDFLFVTAMLTILSFSVHDTIVVYDRIRESQKKIGGNLTDLADKATTETMVRSLNNSFTIIFMLLALILLGGASIRWFAVALLVGTISGTYSSPFVAVPLLVSWDEAEKKFRKIAT